MNEDKIQATVTFMGGPFDKVVRDLPRTPAHVFFGKHLYELIRDPDTGEGLNAYAYVPEKGT